MPGSLELAAPDGSLLTVRVRMHPRARRLRLVVDGDGARLSCPPGTPLFQLRAFAARHAGWLQDKLGQFAPPAGLEPLQPGVETTFPLRGEATSLRWRQAVFPGVQLEGDTLWIGLPQLESPAAPARARSLLAGFLDASMRRDLAPWLTRYSARLGRAPSGLRLRPVKTLWGSLDSRNRVNLDLALALAPPAALRYVLIHELCHLHVRNHSPAFWARVEALEPDWREQRAWLREHGHRLKAGLARLVGDP